VAPGETVAMQLYAFLTRSVATMGVLVDDAVTALAPVEEFYGDVAGWLDEARNITEGDRPLASLKPAVPVPPTARVLCAGLNYAPHAAEGGFELPEKPNLFARWASTLVPAGTPIPVPHGEPGLDWEVELAVVIGAAAGHGSDPADALLGYTVFNDVSAREHQRATSQWALGKNPDNSGPIGSLLVTPDELDAGDLALTTRVNGEVMQEGRTSEMIFNPAELIAYATETMSLRPGDIFATGTPAGVGFARTPPVFMTAGDVVEVEIEGLGSVTNPIVDRT
jgi:2-keto-4-pentenoate hydratase/2-oxohepta-3-ene-1,7-dioic acid hydratase in catechol pathway